MSALAPTLDDIDSGVSNLAQLLDALVENLLNMECPASRTDLNRACAFSLIARDMSRSLSRDIDGFHTSVFPLLNGQKSGVPA